MSKQTSNRPDHEEIVSLLPWFVNKTLDGDKRETVSSHIEHCDECQREIRFLESINETVQCDAQNSYSMHADMDRNLASVMNRIDETRQQTHTLPAGASSLLDRLGDFLAFATGSPATRWSATALLALLVAVSGFQIYSRQSADAYSVLSSSDIDDSSMRLSVEMAPTVDQEQAQFLIAHEMEKRAHQFVLDIETDGTYTLVLKDAMNVVDLSKLIADLERETPIKSVMISP